MMSRWRFLLGLMLLFSALIAKGYSLEGNVSGEFDVWPSSGIVQFKNLSVHNPNGDAYEVCGMDVSLLRGGTTAIADSALAVLTDKKLGASGSVDVGPQRFLLRFPKDLTGITIYVRAYLLRTKSGRCSEEGYFYGNSQNWPSAPPPAGAVAEVPSAIQGESIDAKAKKFLLDNLSSCQHAGSALANVSLSAERLAFTGASDSVYWEVDLKGAQTRIDSSDVEIVCGNGNCVRIAKSPYSNKGANLRCGSANFAGSIKRALDAYIKLLPAAPSF